MRSGPAPTLGFTLIELVLAMSMTCLLALSLYASLQTAFKARESACASVEPMRAVHVALDLIGKDLESAMMPTGILAGSFLGGPSAEGGITSDSLEFYSVGDGAIQRREAITPLDPTQAGGIRKVDVLVAMLQGDTRPVLIRRVTRNLLSARAVVPEDEILCRGVSAFSIRYFDGSAWSATWDSTTLQNSLPLLVEVSLVIEHPVRGASQVGHERSTRVYSLALYQDPATKKGGS